MVPFLDSHNTHHHIKDSEKSCHQNPTQPNPMCLYLTQCFLDLFDDPFLSHKTGIYLSGVFLENVFMTDSRVKTRKLLSS